MIDPIWFDRLTHGLSAEEKERRMRRLAEEKARQGDARREGMLAAIREFLSGSLRETGAIEKVSPEEVLNGLFGTPSDLEDVVNRLLTHLSASERTAYTLYYGLDEGASRRRTLHEVAQVMGRSVPEVNSLLAKAVGKVCEKYDLISQDPQFQELCRRHQIPLVSDFTG